ncbi:MAG: hypothetical protein HQL13_08620, partial [Candidatus Omnitrophica bacterium]|nr:hypothetical protein [Candidatus Omnitrophota bacterium]
ILALRSDSKKESLLWSVMFGVALSVYALFWHGWGFLFFLGMASALAVFAYHAFIIKNQSKMMSNLSFVGLFTGTCLLLVSLFFSFGDFFILFKEGFGELSKFTHRGLDLWPNLFMTVGELKQTSALEIMTSAGGPVLILLALGGWSYRIYLCFRNPNQSQVIDTIIL